MRTCGENFSAIYRIQPDGTDYAIIKIKCKSWDCEPCRKEKARMYKRIIAECFGNEQLYMYTFTFYHNRTEQETWRSYNSAWNTFRTAVTKKYGAMKYVRVLECHKNSNYPHIHLLTSLYIPPLWFGQEVVRAGFGWCADWKRLDNHGACLYISKYLIKEWPREDAKNIRREYRLRIVTMSQGLVEKTEPKCRWYVISNYVSSEKAINDIKERIAEEYIYNERTIEYDNKSDFQVWSTDDWPNWMKTQPVDVMITDPGELITTDRQLKLEFDARD